MCARVCFQAETLFSDFIPLKIIKLDSLLKVKHFNWQPLWPLTWENCSSLLSLCLSFIWLFCQDEGFSITETASLRAPLDIPIPDPPSPEDEVRAPQPVTLYLSLNMANMNVFEITHSIWMCFSPLKRWEGFYFEKLGHSATLIDPYTDTRTCSVPLTQGRFNT